MQKFFDQAISGNWSYNPENYADNEVPVSVMAGDMLYAYSVGHKTAYYQNTYDIKIDEVVEDPKEGLDDYFKNFLVPKRKIAKVAKSDLSKYKSVS